MAHKNSHSAPRKKGGALKIVLVLLVLLLVVAGGGVWMAKREIDGGTPGEEVTVSIQQGSGVAAIAQKLKTAGVIKYPHVFRWYAGKQGAAGKLQYGEFDLAPGSSYDDIIEALSAYAKADSVRLTFPEGTTAIAIAKKMEDAGLCSAEDFLKEANTGDFSQYRFWQYVPDDKDAPDRFLKCEGYLFPDTYDFYKNSTPREVLEKMLDNFGYRFSEEMRAQIDTLNATVTDGSFTVREVTIVASLIEKESAAPSESPRIAGVIYNRLFHWDYPALLNIDAAIIYAQDGVSDHIDTSLDSPYNTYLHTGLTPTPIANPGLASLQAALNPESHNYYYYVLNPATGMHQFSTTQEEHEQYRAQFAAAAAAASTQSEDE